MPAIGERALADRIVYGIPDVLGADATRYAGKRVLVVGSGHSAFNALLDLVDLAEQAPGTEITWAMRKPADRLQNLFGGGINDALPARGELGARVRALVEDGRLRLVTGLPGRAADRHRRGHRRRRRGRACCRRSTRSSSPPASGRISSMLSELRLGLDPAVESPTALAPLIDPNVHCCGTVPPHGARGAASTRSRTSTSSA